MLLFRDSNDRNFWHKILEELRAGTFIAQAEYDTSVLSSLSRNIALIDTLVNIDINDLKNDKKMKLENHQVMNEFTYELDFMMCFFNFVGMRRFSDLWPVDLYANGNERNV